MKKKVCATATKDDLLELGTAMKADLLELGTAMKADLSNFSEEVKSEFKSVRAEMSTKADLSNFREEVKSEFKSVRAEMASGHGRLALQIERQQNDARASEGRLMHKMSALNSQVVDRLEFFTGRMETIWRESRTLPHVIDEQGKKLGDHEVRIKSLEGRTL